MLHQLKKIALFSKSSFLQNVSILTFGTIFAQGLITLILPILTRLYSPEDFGLLAIYVSIVGFASVISTLRFDTAIPLPESDKDAINLLTLAVLVAGSFAILQILIIIWVPNLIWSFLEETAFRPFLWMVPIGVFFAALYSSLQYWNSRKKRFWIITKTRISRAIGSSATQLGMGVATTGTFGLLLGQLSYTGFGIVGLARQLWQFDRVCFNSISVSGIFLAFSKYKRFPAQLAPAAILDSGYQYLPILIMGATVGSSEIGMIFLITRVLALPVSLVGSSISQVFLASSSERQRTGNLGEFTRKIMRYMFIAGAPTLILIGLVLFFLDKWLFGEGYSGIGVMALWMTPWFIIQLASTPVSMVFVTVGRQFEWLLLQTIGFLVIIGSVFLATQLFIEQVVVIFALVNFCFYLMITIAIIRLSYQIDKVQ